MKTIKLFGIIAFVAVIGFTMIGCGGDDDNGGGGGTTPLTWTRSTSTPFGTTKDSIAVAYGGGKFVVLGENLNADVRTAYSTDNGVTWTLGNDTSGRTIAYGGGRFVTGASYSTDGITWTALSSSSTRSFSDAIYVGNKFVAVGAVNSAGTYATNTGILSSSNGESWSSVFNSVFVNGDSVYAIAYGGNKFVVGGTKGKMAYSANGETWTKVTDSTFGSTDIHDIAYGNGRFVAIGSYGTIAYSTNGETWTAATGGPAGGNDTYYIAFGGGRFVAMDENDKIAYSANGETWTQAGNISAGTNNIKDLAYGGGRFVAVGVIGGAVGRMTYSNAQE